MSTRALIVSLSAPEMDRLAVELHSRGALAGLVRRYANKGRRWERSVARLPFLSGAYGSTLGRRLPPNGLASSSIIEAAVLPDFAAAVVNRAGRRVPDIATKLSSRLLSWTEHGVAAEGGRRARRADVVVASYHVALPAFLQSRKLGIPTVLNYPIAHHRWQYRLFAEQARSRPQFADALPRFGDVREHAAHLDREIDLADRILVGSGFVRDTFIGEGVPADRISVVPYGTDLGRFRPADVPRPAGGPFRVLFVGQIGERKGVSFLLEAYAAFRKTDTELHLVGDFVKGSEVYREYSGLYRHTANAPQSQLPDHFRDADVLVLPTLAEGMPMVVLEAMACGLPVIVTPHGPAEVARDGLDGYVVPVGDSDAIVDRLERLYANPDLRREMGRNARSRAEHWTWDRYARRAADVALQTGGCVS